MVAQTGIRYGWKARDAFCRERHCAKCSRKDHHSLPLPQEVKAKLGDQIAASILREFEKQAAQRRFLRGSSPIIFDANGVEYNADTSEPS